MTTNPCPAVVVVADTLGGGSLNMQIRLSNVLNPFHAFCFVLLKKEPIIYTAVVVC